MGIDAVIETAKEKDTRTFRVPSLLNFHIYFS